MRSVRSSVSGGGLIGGGLRGACGAAIGCAGDAGQAAPSGTTGITAVAIATGSGVPSCASDAVATTIRRPRPAAPPRGPLDPPGRAVAPGGRGAQERGGEAGRRQRLPVGQRQHRREGRREVEHRADRATLQHARALHEDLGRLEAQYDSARAGIGLDQPSAEEPRERVGVERQRFAGARDEASDQRDVGVHGSTGAVVRVGMDDRSRLNPRA
jgi:hypothetical protein